jgi:hypothetical protein
MQVQTAIAPPTSTPTHKIWPVVGLVFGLTLTTVWVALLGYGIFNLMELAI